MKFNLTILFLVPLWLFSQSNQCICFSGIGSKAGDVPYFVHQFESGQSIQFCGFLDKGPDDSALYISEFSIFTCATKQLTRRYYALDYCKINVRNDTVSIHELEWMPAKIGEEWVAKAFREQIVFVQNGMLLQGTRPCFEKDNLSQQEITRLLRYLDGFKNETDYKKISELIGLLEYLALNGSVVANERLMKLEDYYQVTTNGADAEHWSSAKNLVTWYYAATNFQ